jgi:hypothetical protein
MVLGASGFVHYIYEGDRPVVMDIMGDGWVGGGGESWSW